MKIDLTKTFELVRGGLLDHENTWKSYFDKTPDWKDTAVVLTAPLVLANVVLSIVFSRLLGGYAYNMPGHGIIVTLIIALIMAIAGVAVSALVFDRLAGIFGGKPDFSRAFAAISFAAMPAWIAGIIGSLIPGVGFLLSLAGLVATLIFLYKIMPLALGVPEDKRVVHFVASIALTVVVQILIGVLVGTGAM